MTATPMRGELWWCEPPEIERRPVVVLSRDAALPRLLRALVAPCTTTIRGLPIEVILEPGDDPISRRSAVNLDSVESVSLGLLVARIGRLSALGYERSAQPSRSPSTASDPTGADINEDRSALGFGS